VAREHCDKADPDNRVRLAENVLGMTLGSRRGPPEAAYLRR
jgi:hypothetical protein